MNKKLCQNTSKMQIQYIVDDNGEKISVILDITIFERLLQELEDLCDTVHAEKILICKDRTYCLEEIKEICSKTPNKKNICKRTK